jgi:hypothetical protein
MHEMKNGYQRAVERGQYAVAVAVAVAERQPVMNALQQAVQSGAMKGPYTHVSDGVAQSGYWHKENHQGPQDCVGCCIDG